MVWKEKRVSLGVCLKHIGGLGACFSELHAGNMRCRNHSGSSCFTCEAFRPSFRESKTDPLFPCRLEAAEKRVGKALSDT